ncbi:MAG TPA: serine protease [Flavipsychrobacter sp.]
MYNNNIWEQAEAWVDGRMHAADRQLLEERKLTDPVFAAEFQDAVNMLRSLQGSGEHKRFKNALAQAHKSAAGQQAQALVPKTISLVRNHWRTATIAACIAILTSLTTFWVAQNNNKKIASQYSLLRRDLETYKRSQNKIIRDIKEQTTVTPQLEARYTGTGFALTNDGYLVTSYHVIAGADSVYIQNRDGNYYKTHVVAFNEATDVVVLKVEDKNFKFGKQDIPYSIAKSKKKLGARVFTLGFPQDEIVYNEGYISAKNGYNGDSSQYRLDIPAGPGQSGAPVADGSGNIIGIITGKESESEGTTYAVASESIIDLLNNLPEENKIKLNPYGKLSKMSREQQIEKLEYYTCAIKVYKK